ncbi:PPOX class F420-dependent oxidoreductase [Hoyosella rhizosphaerae]|uniref:Pyridoxamine 5'-phosphate oxidase N-terminal domain-containing protein n=1 Tax=Hoyosella rhizosphaerae TaxID=1755582 RepID=A0A916U1Q3_9ACTN|nr:PPOX class F420-dependent oxidoreductase [Hoyosella rhizosphaerae]MBN4927192.1 PPOX class F420-dependent oxidoreductase [Hoyosella rhizosphaerae]GGC53294.1 hypothetical protein GCM10011410_02030 [Hoyosella rhizosphaerae]
MTSDLDHFGQAKYVSLTTFRKDGTPVATPVWVASDGDRLLVWTVTDSWKVKRVRKNPKVTIQQCDMRGNASGPVVEGHAEVLDDDGTALVRKAIKRKYGITGTVAINASLLRRGKRGTIGLAVTV